ncbi:MAG: ribokinase [Nitriliruptoraceae bacterium]|nr:ribokinase [Nitriliruptoraceae bacterium]
MRDDAGGEPQLVVVGSTNLDIVVPVRHIPRPGETVVGDDHFRVPGGKGGNQAVACARMGGRTAFVGCIGDDDAGRTLRDSMERAGVDTTSVEVIANTPSGVALIVVDDEGENTVTVSPGANSQLSADRLPSALLGGAAAVLIQLEIPLETAVRAAELAGGSVVLNPAPGRALPDALLRHVDVLVPNRSELAILSGRDEEPQQLEEIEALARALPGSARVVVTLGADGALVIEDTGAVHVPAHRVRAVDATGAGDTFCGALSVALVEGADLVEAARTAVAAAGLSVTVRGAQPSMPQRDAVERLLAERA